MTVPKIDHLEVPPGHPESLLRTVIDGVDCYAFTLKSGWVQDWDSANIGPNGKPNERVEISLDVGPTASKGKGPYTITAGILQTYDIDFRFKGGWPTHDPAQHGWGVPWQAHPQDNNPSGFAGFTGISIHGMEITLGTPGDRSGVVYFARESIKTDVWLKRRLVVNWSSKPDGFVKWIDRDTGRLIGRYDGPTIAAGEFHYLKQGYYRAGGLPDATIYETLMDISEGDLSETTTATPPPAQGATTQTVQAYAAQLLTTRDALKREMDAINALLSKP